MNRPITTETSAAAAVHCPALLVSAPASGQGKTTVTAALARYHRKQGRRVRVFKSGPDFLDPMILECASGQPVYQLDLFMGGLEHCRALLYDAATEADLIVIEGAMGLFDGNPSSADIALAFGVPVLPVIDANAMAQTFAAVAHGLASYRPELAVLGVVANRVAGEGHAQMLREALPATTPLFAALTHDAAVRLPERHLGLVSAAEIDSLESSLQQTATAWAQAGVTGLPPAVAFAHTSVPQPPKLLEGVRVAVARDAAFAFLYPANLDLLRAMGAELRFFSPLAGDPLPQCDSLYLPGGYPELHLHRLAAQGETLRAIQGHHRAGKPILAECGGMLYLADSLTGSQGEQAKLVGLLPGHARMHGALRGLGLQAAPLPEGVLRGHSFHYSELSTALEPLTQAGNPNGGKTSEAIYRLGRLTASYMHFYFPSNPAAAAALLAP